VKLDGTSVIEQSTNLARRSLNWMLRMCLKSLAELGILDSYEQTSLPNRLKRC